MTVPKSPPGGKPADVPGGLRSDARRNRERVLRAAREAFAAEGAAVPLDEIARRAGVGAGTVYRHFPTKEALFEAVVSDRLQGLIGEARSLLEAGDPGGAFFGFFTRVVVEGVAKKDIVDALAGEGVEVDFAGSRAARNLGEAVAGLLERARRAGAVRKDVGAEDVMALLTGASLAIRHHGGGTDAADRVVAVVSDGLRPVR